MGKNTLWAPFIPEQNPVAAQEILCVSCRAHEGRGPCSTVQLVLCLTTPLGFLFLMSPLTYTQGLHWDLCLSPVDSEVCMLMTSLPQAVS